MEHPALQFDHDADEQDAFCRSGLGGRAARNERLQERWRLRRGVVVLEERGAF